MSRIFLTGDTHGSLELKKLSHKNFPLGRELTYNDTLIILGDAGFMWDDSKETEYWDDWANDLGFTIAAVRGNHDNHDAIDKLPFARWNGGFVRKVRPHVMYLENGEIYTINNQTFFCMGGATSIDKYRRTEGKNWWSGEMPSKEDYENAVENLENYNMTVNHILTHTPPNFILDKWYYQHDELTNFLSHYVQTYVKFNDWWCGHLHIDRNFGENYFT